MEFQSVPSLSGGGVGKKAWTVVMRGEKKIGKVKEESYPSIEAAFTLPQLQELQRQTLIHRHLAAGLPVPVHLVLPIWKSVAASLDFFKQFPSYIGHSRQGFDYWHMMEPDPGRCRRTDGKKWRCSKNVIVDQKYCERHMHRGCQRSRKLVEASEVASPSNPTTTRPEKSKGKTPQNPSSNLLGLQLMTTSSNVTNINHGSSTTIASNLGKKRVSYVTSPFITANTTNGSGTSNSAIATNYSNPVFTSIKCNQNTVKDMGEVYLGNTSTIKGSSTNNTNVSVGRTMCPVLGFFPKSVLQVVRHDGRCIDNRNGMEREPGRCRRTDGKKWRCRGDIIPDQKYCARHMHRGVKKLAKAVEPPTSSASTKTVPVPLVTPSSCRVDHPSPNTNLSISITTSPPPISKDEKSDSGNSSDTTITDTSICAYAISKLPA